MFPVVAEGSTHQRERESSPVVFTSAGRIGGKTFAVQIANFFAVHDGLIQSDDGVYDTGGRPCAP